MLKYFFLFCCISISSFSQIIRVENNYTQEKIEGVVVVDLTTHKKWLTNKKGEASVDLGANNSYLLFKHKNYFSSRVLLSDIDDIVVLKPKYEDLESVVLSVSRIAEKKQKIPEQIEIITKRNIEYISPQTTADLLANTPGVRVQKSQLGGGSPVIRGMESNRVLLVVDGVRMNNAIYRNGHLQNTITVSPFTIDRAEVVFGPTSVSYGSDALGGVIHYYTKKLNYTNKFQNKNDVFYRHSTANKEQTGSFSSYNNHKKWASYTNISFSNFDDLRMGRQRKHGFENWGKVFEYSKNTEKDYYKNSSLNKDSAVQKNTGYYQLDLLQKFKVKIHDRIDLVLNSQYSSSSNVPNFGKLNDVNDRGLKFAEWYYGPQKRLLLSTQAKFKDYKSLLQDGTITLAYQNIKESRVNRKFGSLDRASRFENVKVLSLNSDFYKSLTKKGNRKLFYGMELVHNLVNSSAKAEKLDVLESDIIGFQNKFDIDTRYPSGGSSYSSAAIYSSYRQHLNKKHTLNVGLRLTKTLLKASWGSNVTIPIVNNRITLNNKELTGSVGYIYRPFVSDKISVVLAKGFRAPNVDDVGKIRAKSGKLTVPNTALKPEHLYSAELGYAKISKNKRAKFNINVYYTLLNDYIARSPSQEFGSSIIYDDEYFEEGAILANTNQGKAAIYGGSLSTSLEFLTDFKFNLGLTYTEGNSLDTKQPLSSIPPVFGNVSLGWYKKKFDLALMYRASAAKKIQDYNVVEGIDNLDETPNRKGTPAWSVLNFNGNYYVNDDLRIQFQLQNVLDVHYKEFASSISAPGRNLVASLAYSF